jgi:predicted adenylyl cyclase CyaB
MDNIEVEITVNIENSKSLIEFLEKNAEFKKEKHQVDEYFSPAHRNFVEVRPVKEWLRLRNEDGKYSINYKNWHYDDDPEKSSYCDEYETKVEDLGKIKKILEALDLKSLVKVDKLRKTWVYNNYEIDVDLVKELGDFIEIEYIGKEKVDPKKTTDEMVSFLKKLGCGKIKRDYVGYPFRLLFPNEAKWEEQ